MALISEKKLVYNPPNGSGCATSLDSNEINYYSQTILLNKRIDFKSAKEYEDESDEDGSMSAQQLKTKYNLLVPCELPANGFISSSKLSKLVKSNKNQDKDGDDLGEPKHMLYPKENIVLTWKKISKIGSGLYNLGNTCFMNSVLQCLTYCPPLNNFLNSNKDDHSEKCDQGFCMICLMTKHIGLAQNRNAQVISPKYIQSRLRSICKHFVCGRQEDAHEFLRYVIDHMWRSCLAIHEIEFGISGTNTKFDNLTKSTTAINHIFGGYCRSQVVCSICRAKSNTYDYIMDLMLDIQNVSSLEEALQKFVTPELLKNENAYKCSKCKRAVTAHKQFTVFRAPNVATFQFKRFDCGRMFVKVTKLISYPEYLNLRPYMSEKGPPMRYKLISVLVHLGASCNSGHYYCYVRNTNDCWYLMDDTNVCQASINDVLNQKAYVLMYVRDPKVKAMESLATPKSDSIAEKVRINHAVISPHSSNEIFNSNFKFTPNKSPPNSHVIRPIGPKPLGISNVKGVKLTAASIHSDSVDKWKKEHKNGTAVKSIVPYESDDDSKTENGDATQEAFSVTQVSDSDLAKPSPLLQSLPIKSDFVKEGLKMKVEKTSTSWQVVQTNSNQSNVEIEKSANANWLVSKTNPEDFDNFSNNLPVDPVDKSSSGPENSNCDNRLLDSEKERRKRDRKEKRKRQKEARKRKSRDSDDSDRIVCDNANVTWTERTLETVKFENCLDSDKRKLSEIENHEINIVKKLKLDEDGNSKDFVRDTLLKSSCENVKSWHGGVSTSNRVTDMHRPSSFDEDEYNDEFDQGKMKKVRNHFPFESKKRKDFGRNNQFQLAYHNKHSYTRNYNKNPYRSSSPYIHNKNKPFRHQDGHYKEQKHNNYRYQSSNGYFSNHHGNRHHKPNNNFSKNNFYNKNR